MSDDRQALIDAMARALCTWQFDGDLVFDRLSESERDDCRNAATAILDALLADPVRLLRVIAAQTVPCPTCWGRAGELTPPAKCKNPACEGGEVPVDVLSLLQTAGVIERRHIIKVTEYGWSLQHPLSCRPHLLDCIVHRAVEQEVQEQDIPLVDPGDWEVTVDDEGAPVFVAARRGGTS